MARRMRLLALLALLVPACGTRPAVSHAPDGASSVEPSVPTADTEWIAVMAHGQADDLEDETAQLMEAVPENIAVGPIGCWPGLAGALGRPSNDEYVAAIVAPSRDQLDRVLAKLDRQPEFQGQFPSVCGD